MKIVWITARNFSRDLAKRTEIGIGERLSSNGHEIVMISPGKLSSKRIKHYKIKTLRFPGLNTISGARDVSRKLNYNVEILEKCQLIMIDWRYVHSLRNFLQSTSIPWCIIDRGPPADRGILKILQKRFWSKSWEIANSFAMGGFTVSDAHTTFVRKRKTVEIPIHAIPAGSEPNTYLERKNDPRDMLKFVYIGRLDKRRGVREMIRLSEKMVETKIKHEFNIYGDGDENRMFNLFSRENDFFNFHGTLESEKIPPLLAESHIGIMPMPDIEVWRISSPLKLAEYLSAGLVIVGPKHSGNEIDVELDSIILSENDDWPVEAIAKIEEKICEDWRELASKSVSYSERLSWRRITDDMEKCLIRWMS